LSSIRCALVKYRTVFDLFPIECSTLVRHYLIERPPTAERIATAHILWVSVDAANGRPIRQPMDWLDDFRSNIA
jgi:acyl-CoA thioesterase FadM